MPFICMRRNFWNQKNFDCIKNVAEHKMPRKWKVKSTWVEWTSLRIFWRMWDGAKIAFGLSQFARAVLSAKLTQTWCWVFGLRRALKSKVTWIVNVQQPEERPNKSMEKKIGRAVCSEQLCWKDKYEFHSYNVKWYNVERNQKNLRSIWDDGERVRTVHRLCHCYHLVWHQVL